MTKIIQRHDTAANWASVNPVLAQGEIGIEDDTRKFKFGDGTTAWADLPYASSESSDGAGGTSNYNDLTNKPTINTLELQGELALGGALKIERASTDAFYNSARNASNQLTFSKASGYFNRNRAEYNYIYGTAGLKINSDGTITPSSYFMMPYKLRDIIVCASGTAATTKIFLVLYGYKTNGRFKPVVKAIDHIGKSAYTYPITSFSSAFLKYSYTYYKTTTLYTDRKITPDETYKDTTTYPSLNNAHNYMSSLVYDEGLGLYKIYHRFGAAAFTEYQFNATMNEELQKVDTVMVLYSDTVTTPSVDTNFEIKDGSTVTGNFLTDMTYPELIALPSVEVPEVIEHNVLSTGNIPNSYVGLDEKPKINGNELVGDINSTDLNIQRVMTPNGGINIVQNGDWHFFDANYDDTAKQITFDRYDFYTTGDNVANKFKYALNSTSTSASKIGTFIDKEKIIPTCGIITPFYKNVTWKFGATNSPNCNRLVFGNYINGYFYPKYIMCPHYSIDNLSYSFKRISSISENSITIFNGTNVPYTSTSVSVANSVSPLNFITILYNNNTYIFKRTYYTTGNYIYHMYTITITEDTEGLNSCTHCWYIPNYATMGYNTTTQLATGDWSLDCFNANMDNTKLNDALILPDSGSNVFTTSISVKTDGVTTKINDSGQLEAIAPANMVTTDNIASDATISTMSGNITTLTENMGGMKLVKITQTDYNSLATKDENTLYIITG